MTAYATYATVADATALNKARKLGQGSNPTEADVTRYLEFTAAQLNSILTNKGVAVPVTEAEAPNAYQLLRRLNALGAAVQMEEASATPGPSLDRLRAGWEQGREDLEKAQTVLDAPLNTARTEVRGPGVTTPALKFGQGEVFDPNLLRGSTNSEGLNPNAPYLARDLTF